MKPDKHDKIIIALLLIIFALFVLGIFTGKIAHASTPPDEYDLRMEIWNRVDKLFDEYYARTGSGAYIAETTELASEAFNGAFNIYNNRFTMPLQEMIDAEKAFIVGINAMQRTDGTPVPQIPIPVYNIGNDPGTGNDPGNDPIDTTDLQTIENELETIRTMMYEGIEVITAVLLWSVGLAAFGTGLKVMTIFAIIWGRNS